MFSLQIVDTDAFLEMPMTSQLLYFHLAMRADDEGFVGNPKRIVKMVGSNDDDFKVLIAKRFLLAFESGVVVIKHWLIHNTIRMDRFAPTKYNEEKNGLIVKENKSYTELATSRQPNGNQLATQVKLSKDKLSKDKISNTAVVPTADNPINKIFDIFYKINPNLKWGNTTQRKAVEEMIKQHGEEKITKMAQYAVSIHGQPFSPTITTPYQLQLKMSELVAYWKKQEGQHPKAITI
jgi:hypothetical protein